MNYDRTYSKPPHGNRPLSLGGLNTSLPFLNSSNTKTSTNDSYLRVASHLARDSPFKNTTPNQNSLRQILSPQTSSMSSTSQFQTRSSASKLCSSANLTARSSKNSHERTKSAIVDKENEYENTLTFAVQAAYDMQKEKEKEFAYSKVSIEQDISEQESLIEETTSRLNSQKEITGRCHRNLEVTLTHLEEVLRNSRRSRLVQGEIVSWLETSDELLKEFFKIDRSLRGDLTKISDADKKETSLVSLRRDKEELEKSTEQMSTLVYKLTDAEDRLRQVVECRYMAEEDIDSHVVMATESIFMQEDVSDIMDDLERRNPTEFGHAKREIWLAGKLEEGIAAIEEESIIIENLAVVNENAYRECLALEERDKGISKEIEALRSRLTASESQILESSSNLVAKVSAGLRQLRISEGQIQKVVEYIFVFGTQEVMEGMDKVMLIEFQDKILEEVIYTLRQTQVIDNLEAKLAAANNSKADFMSSKRPYDLFDGDSKIQNSIITEKLDLNDKLITFKVNRREAMEALKNNIANNGGVSSQYEVSFYDIFKETLSKSDPSIRNRAGQCILDTANKLKTTTNTYLIDQKAINTKQREDDEVKRLINELKQKITNHEAALQERREALSVREEEFETMTAEIKSIQALFMGNINGGQVEEPKSLRIAEKMLERECVQTRRGESLVKLKNNFSKAKDMSREYKKIKGEIINAEAQLSKLEEYRNKISSKIEQELKPNLKKFKNQKLEFSMKVNMVQKELLSLLQKKQASIRGLEARLYTLLDDKKRPEEGLVSKALTEVLTCKDYIYQFLCKLREQILSKFSSKDGEMTCIEVGEAKSMKKEIEGDINNLAEDDRYLDRIQKQLADQKEALKTKKAMLLDIEKEVNKYKNFYEVSNELLKEKVLTTRENASHLSMSLLSVQKDALFRRQHTPSPIPSLVLQSKNPNLMYPSQENRYVIDSLYSSKVDKTEDPGYITPKTEIEMESEPVSLSSSSTKTRSTSINFQSTSVKSNNSDKLLNHDSAAMSESKRSSVTKPEKILRCLAISDEELGALIKEFQQGFPIYKRFAESNKIEEKVSVTLSMKGRSKAKKDFKGYGRRVLQLNLRERSIDVIKAGVSGLRSVVEYKYDWESVKQVMLPQKTLQALKDLKEAQRETEKSLESGHVEASFSNPHPHGSVKETEEGTFDLKLWMDVANKGRIDFLMDKAHHVTALWNVVHVLGTQGNLSFFVGN